MLVELLILLVSFSFSTNVKIKLHLTAKTMKTGGLRLYCSLYLMGLQNTPEPKCWKAQQFDSHEVIQFTDNEITVDRLGSWPSHRYLIDESMILNGFLDELNSIVNEGDVSEEKRLLTLPEPCDAIEKAREAVSFA